MSSDCITEYDICIIRGDTFKLDVGLSSAFAEVIANPQFYVANMVFRAEQDDNLTPYLTITVPPEINADPLLDEPPIYFRFEISKEQTRALPAWNHVYYIEIEQIGPPSVTVLENKRLFEGDVDVHD